MRRVLLGIGITLMWAVISPLEIWFFTRVFGWPKELSLLILIPLLVLWVPVSYPLALAGDERHRRGQSAVGNDHFLKFAFVMTVGYLCLVMTVLFSWLFLRSPGSHAAATVLLVIAAVETVAAWYVAFRVLAKMRAQPEG